MRRFTDYNADGIHLKREAELLNPEIFIAALAVKMELPASVELLSAGVEYFGLDNRKPIGEIADEIIKLWPE